MGDGGRQVGGRLFYGVLRTATVITVRFKRGVALDV